MDKEVLKSICGMCDNIEELVRGNFAKRHDYVQQKILLDLYISVINFQHYYKANIGA